MTNTQNKGFPLQVTGTNVGTWGTIVNTSVFSVLDNNLGGTLALSVAGSSNVNLTASQASFLMHDLTGVLTGNIAYIFPAMGGFYAINNQTTGAFAVTVQIVGGGASVVAIQGQTTIVFIDATGLNVLAASTGSVNSGTAGQLAFYSTTGTAVSGDANATISNGALTLGIASSVQGSLKLSGSTSGTTTIAAPTAGTGTMTLQAGNDTLIAKATTDTLTNKTFDTAGTGNVFKINGTAITAISGNTATAATTSGTLTSGHLAKFDASGNIIDDGISITALSGNTTTAATISGSLTSTHIAVFDASGNIVDGGVASTFTKGTQLVKNPYATSSSTQQAHGLSGIPNLFLAQLVNLSTELGYQANDVVDINGGIMGGFGSNAVITINADATNVNVTTGSSTPYIGQKTTGGDGTQITASKWKLVVTPILM